MGGYVPDPGRGRVARGLVLFAVFIVAGQAVFDAIYSSLAPLLPLCLVGLVLLMLLGWLRSRRSRR